MEGQVPGAGARRLYCVRLCLHLTARLTGSAVDVAVPFEVQGGAFSRETSLKLSGSQLP